MKRGSGGWDLQAGCRFAGPQRVGQQSAASRRPSAPAPPRDLDLAYIYDDSLEGLLSAIFQAYARHQNPGALLPSTGAQLALGQRAEEISADGRQALRVRNGIVSQLGAVTFNDVERVFLSDAADRGTAAYRFLRRGFEVGGKVRNDLAHPDVARFAQLSVSVAAECERVRQFTRFRQMEGGVFYARISPTACVIPLVMGGFAARMGPEPFLLYDDVHQLAGVWDGRRWGLRRTTGVKPPAPTAAEAQMARLWRTFYQTIGVEQRACERLRRQLMPVRFWPHMTEFETLD